MISFEGSIGVKLVLVAACALIDTDGRVLLAERPAGRSMAGLWEFPGGKVEAGERPGQTLVPELAEEMGVLLEGGRPPPRALPRRRGSHSYADFHLLMPLYVCRRWHGIVVPRERQKLAWVRPNRLRD